MRTLKFLISHSENKPLFFSCYQAQLIYHLALLQFLLLLLIHLEEPQETCVSLSTCLLLDLRSIHSLGLPINQGLNCL